MSSSNPYINEYLQKQQGKSVQVPIMQVPMQSYTPQYAMKRTVESAKIQQSIPREYNKFPAQTTTGFDSKDAYTGLNVFDQKIMKNSLDAEKVVSVDRKTFESHINNAQKTREEIDKQLTSNKSSAIAPTTIKVEKKPIDDLNAIAARRDKEAAQIKVEKVTNDASSLLGGMSVKKTDPNQLNRQMDELLKRRQMEMQNINYK